MYDKDIFIPAPPQKKSFEYQFILLNGEDPIGCIKGYSKEKNGIDETVIYICGMKNTFHIETEITECEMRDFLHLVMSPIFTETFFGSKLYMAGFKEGRQLFCSVTNEQKDFVLSNWKDEMNAVLEQELEKGFKLDIYPDQYEEDNEKGNGSDQNVIPNEDCGNRESDDGSDEDGNGADHVLDEIALPEEEERPHDKPPRYEPLVRLTMEDLEYGVLLDIDITGFIDSHHKDHHKPHPQEFDKTPDDDLIQEEFQPEDSYF